MTSVTCSISLRCSRVCFRSQSFTSPEKREQQRQNMLTVAIIFCYVTHTCINSYTGRLVVAVLDRDSNIAFSRGTVHLGLCYFCVSIFKMICIPSCLVHTEAHSAPASVPIQSNCPIKAPESAMISSCLQCSSECTDNCH